VAELQIANMKPWFQIPAPPKKPKKTKNETLLIPEGSEGREGGKKERRKVEGQRERDLERRKK
jgi:hypothetical protein